MNTNYDKLKEQSDQKLQQMVESFEKLSSLTSKELTDKLNDNNPSTNFAKSVFGVDNLDKITVKKKTAINLIAFFHRHVHSLL